jgi:hypothetical protein
MIKPPPSPILKFSDLRNWLRDNGIREYTVVKLIESGHLKGRCLPPSRVRYYCAAEVQREVLKLLDP